MPIFNGHTLPLEETDILVTVNSGGEARQRGLNHLPLTRSCGCEGLGERRRVGCEGCLSGKKTPERQ